MPTASRSVRKMRRIKRDRTLAWKMASMALAERNQARMVAVGLEKELRKYTDDPFPEDDPAPAPVKEDRKMTVTKLQDQETEGVESGD